MTTMTMTTTATADELGTEIESRRERIRELSDTAATLEKSLAIGKNTIAAAIAAHRSDDADAARKSVRANTEGLAETTSAIELLNRERVDLEARLKQAEKREATECVGRLSAEAAGAIDALNDAVLDASRGIAALASDARAKIDRANSADQEAAQLNGQPWSMPRFGWHGRPGLADTIEALQHYERTVRGDFTVKVG